MSMFKFLPLLKSTIWGGEKIAAFKNVPDAPHQVGESWEVSGVKDNESVVAEGPYKGCSLNQLVRELKADLVGHDNYERFGNGFPLLVKFIDAHDQLSIQVHPTDEQAQTMGESRGKTEMWYVMESDAEASLYCGLKQKITPEEYKQMVADSTITDALARYEVKEGDVFFLPAGRIHSIGRGCFLAEIQETSDVTYRIYDFGRKDKDGNMRELHTEQAAHCIDYSVSDDYRTAYEPKKNIPVELVKCRHFTTSLIDTDSLVTLDLSQRDSFVVLVGLRGSATLINADGETVSFAAGESVLVPATETSLTIKGNMKLLTSYV
jgi:mannose-6-phosphate isomerase